MSLISFRDLVGFAYTEDEVKSVASEIEVIDGPNDEGEMYTRPGKPSDHFPNPYPNEQAARFANGGAYPPDLSLITKVDMVIPNLFFNTEIIISRFVYPCLFSRHATMVRTMAHLTGYCEPPAGVLVCLYYLYCFGARYYLLNV